MRGEAGSKICISSQGAAIIEKNRVPSSERQHSTSQWTGFQRTDETGWFPTDTGVTKGIPQADFPVHVIIFKYQVLSANVCLWSAFYALSGLYKSENSIFFPSGMPTQVDFWGLLDCWYSLQTDSHFCRPPLQEKKLSTVMECCLIATLGCCKTELGFFDAYMANTCTMTSTVHY